MEKSITITSIEELTAVAEWLGEQITQSGLHIVAIYGQMGAGKTTLISQFCKLNGALQTATSPTFSIINTYDTPHGLIFHFDLYRIEDERSAEELALSEYFYHDNSISLIEWPENIEKFIPNDMTLRIEIKLTQNGGRKFSVAEHC